MSEYETLGSGAVASRFVTDINDVDEFIGQSVSKLLIAVLSLVAVTIILLWMHWLLAVFILFANPFVVYVTTALGKKVKMLKARENRAFEVFQQSLTESLDAIQQIRAANREKRFISHVIDEALGVEDGPIIEQGSHAELIDANGLYRKLYGSAEQT